MIFLHLLFHIGKEKLLCPLQSLPTLPSLNHEGFACSHLGCIPFWFFCFHGTGIHPLLLFYTELLTPPLNRRLQLQKRSQLFTRTHDETLSVAMHVKSDCVPARTHA